MALIRCPECGREISDQAESCPGCGCPKTVWSTDRRLEEARQRDRKFLMKVGLLLLLGIAAILTLALLSGNAS